MNETMTLAELIERNAGARQIYDQLVKLRQMELPPSMIVRTVDGRRQVDFVDNPANAPVRELENKLADLLQKALRAENSDR